MTGWLSQLTAESSAVGGVLSQAPGWVWAMTVFGVSTLVLHGVCRYYMALVYCVYTHHTHTRAGWDRRRAVRDRALRCAVFRHRLEPAGMAGMAGVLAWLVPLALPLPVLLVICMARTSRGSVKTLAEIVGYRLMPGQDAPLFDGEENDERGGGGDGGEVHPVRQV